MLVDPQAEPVCSGCACRCARGADEPRGDGGSAGADAGDARRKGREVRRGEKTGTTERNSLVGWEPQLLLRTGGEQGENTGRDNRTQSPGGVGTTIGQPSQVTEN